ncbi:MAG: metallophosphoesterase family protein [Coriobacteriia bacterium]
MRRIAVFSDIHANLAALDAVLDDMDAAGIAECYCLGDLIGYGPDPGGVIARIRDAVVPTIPGNYDEGVASRRGDCGCYYATDEARADGDASYRFTNDLLTQADADWLLSLPGQIRLTEGGASILLTHGSPRKINEYLLLDRAEAQLARLAAQAGADVVCHGHVHLAFHRSFAVAYDVAGSDADSGAPADARQPRIVHYVSSGSVGKPKDGDPRAAWVEMIFAPENAVRAAAPDDAAAARVGEIELWLGTVVHRVAYDIDATVAAMDAAGLPARLGAALRTGG